MVAAAEEPAVREPQAHDKAVPPSREYSATFGGSRTSKRPCVLAAEVQVERGSDPAATFVGRFQAFRGYKARRTRSGLADLDLLLRAAVTVGTNLSSGTSLQARRHSPLETRSSLSV